MFYKLIIFITIYILIYNDSFGNVNKDKVISYLESFNSLKSDFIQVNNSGEILSGNLLVSRPGKFRIEYKQIPLLLISDSKRIAIINKDLNNISFHRFDEIPAGVLLFKKLSLKDINILNLEKKNNTITAHITDSKFKDYGYIKILFELNPLEMKKWTIVKNDNTKTEVFFDNIFFDNEISPEFYNIEKEDPRKVPFYIN